MEMGGGTTSVLNYYKGLVQKREIQLTVVSTVSKEEIRNVDQWVVENSDFKFFPVSNLRWRYSKYLNEYLKNNIMNYDIVWIHAIWLSHSYFSSKYCLRYNIPYIISLHGLLESYSIKQKYFKKKIYWYLAEKKVFNHAAAIHCLTKTEQNTIRQISDINTFVVPNSVNTEPFLEKEFDKLRTICFVGRFHKKKALDLLLRAIARIPNLKLLVAGGGEKKYEKYIYNLVKELQIGDRVEFKGFANKAVQKEIFQESAFLVLPSYSEGLSMVGLESVMNSTPVLTTRKCNFDEVEQYNAGMVMEDNSPKTIKEYILKMFDSNIEEMSKNAHALAMEKFSIDSVSEKMLSEIEKIIR